MKNWQPTLRNAASVGSVTADSGAIYGRRVLMVTFRFPPIVVPNSFRSGKFAKYLPEFGWLPVILTAGALPSNILDPALVAELPEEVVTVIVPCRWPNVRGLTHIRKWLPILALENLWRPLAVRVGLALIQQWKCELIWSTAPPLSCHLIGAELKRRTGLPLIVDYRDLWTLNPQSPESLTPTRVHRWYHHRLELRALLAANGLVAISESMASQLLSMLPTREQMPPYVRVIPNGYDPSDFGKSSVPPIPYVCAYVGSIYLSRIPTALHLVETLRLFEEQYPEQAAELRVNFIGSVAPEVTAAVRAKLRRIKLSLLGRVPHDEAVHGMFSASLLILLLDPSEMGQVSSKVFEYLATNRPILAIGHSEAVRGLLKDLQDCRHVDGSDPHVTLAAMRELLTLGATGQIGSNQSSREDLLLCYSRRRLARELSDLFSLVSGNTSYETRTRF